MQPSLKQKDDLIEDHDTMYAQKISSQPVDEDDGENESLEQSHQATLSSAQSPRSQPADEDDDEDGGEGEGEKGYLTESLSTQRHQGLYRQIMDQSCEK